MKDFYDEKQEKMYKTATIVNFIVHALTFLLGVFFAFYTNRYVIGGYMGVIFLVGIFSSLIFGLMTYFSYLLISIFLEKFKNSSIIAKNAISDSEAEKYSFDNITMMEDLD